MKWKTLPTLSSKLNNKSTAPISYVNEVENKYGPLNSFFPSIIFRLFFLYASDIVDLYDFENLISVIIISSV